MRAPTSLEDTGLLQHEPFVSSFRARHEIAGFKKEMPQVLMEKILGKLEAEPGSFKAVEKWRKLAFEPDESYQKRTFGLRNQDRSEKNHSRKLLKHFIKFYWYLFCGLDAKELLRSQKLGGYTTRQLPHTSVKLEPMDEPMSPLSELSDSDDTMPATARDAVDPLRHVAAEAPSPLIAMRPSASLAVKQSSPALAPQVPQSVFMEPSLAEDTGLLNAPEDSYQRDQPAPELEFPAIARTPDRAKIVVRRPPAPGRRKPGRPPKVRPALALAPGGLLLDEPGEINAPNRLPQAPNLFAPPVCEERFLSAVPNNRPPIDPLPRLHVGINIKTELLEEESEWLRLLNPGENWLDLPVPDEPAHETHELSVLNLTTEPRIISKEPLKRLPPIWAQSRQEMCESFEWFRSYQGGVYQNDGTVKGYLMSGFPAQRDCFECGGKLIISHGGGKADSSRTRRGHVTNITADDQRVDDLSVRALMNNYRTGQPIVLLIDDKYGPFPFDLAGHNVYMAVLAEYQPSNSNANGRVVRYKFAFQWCEGQGEPWWLNQSTDSSMSDHAEKRVKAAPKPAEMSPLKPANLYNECTSCFQSSPHVYRTWACLNHGCNFFWMSGHALLPSQLDYNPKFLSVIDSRPLPFSYQGTLLPMQLVPNPKDGVTTSYAYSRGWHCRKCGRLSCRSAWEHYKCPSCQDTHEIIGNIRPAKGLLSFPVPISGKFLDSVVDDSSGIERLPTKMFYLEAGRGATGHCQTFVLPEGKGKIHLIQAGRLAGAEADRIFEAYQQQAFDGTLLFRRWPAEKLRGPLLTNYFSQNCTDNTVPFDRAPGAVLQARELIQKRMREALAVNYEFNEVLSAAYMEQQKMAFHSDSEQGLGPIVAGLSMGSPALMHFRLLSKYVPRDEQLTSILTIVLRHGDVLVMDGAGVQDFYQYVPCNFRIAATARWISPNHT
ncbi:hypothetical protein B0H16DRAFT_1545390 [Mycena metata]|uniref:Alpha-ketoglutarate-dependent dioxygenase AlkB-like domain-containing protein n=1 Tax=Mycena metata TaxID=1033252 RepID=A0AAD7IZE9_9AGAR|nr:hypothetical protein B0H16DRAFT_1545390 [Mycena metata]